MTSLGQELKRAREERGISLHDVANRTHIGVRFLQAIESDSYDILPGGVFNRAFVRKFAQQVGLDEEQALKLYEEQLKELGGEPERVSYLGLDDEQSRSSSGNGMLFSLLALLILGAGLYGAYLIFNRPASSNQAALATPTPQSTPAPVASPTTSPTPESTPISGLLVGLTAGDQECWVRVKADGKTQDLILPPQGTQEVAAEERVMLTVGRLNTLQVTINGRPANWSKLAPGKTIVAENVLITKDNYQQFLD
jgi:cytoskeleton protein RodZ